jgi:hypothetical protein
MRCPEGACDGKGVLKSKSGRMSEVLVSDAGRVGELRSDPRRKASKMPRKLPWLTSLFPTSRSCDDPRSVPDQVAGAFQWPGGNRR